MPSRTWFAPLAATVALAAAAPAAHAVTMPKLSYKMPALPRMSVPVGFGGGAACGNAASGGEGQGRTGGIDTTVCNYGLSYVGPQSSITTTVGPTIISANFTGNVITSAGNVAVIP
jgi:hypothetical protein